MPTRRTLGYIKNEWTCPNCSTRNKGSVKTCENCGAPQPENVQFELPSEQKFVTDEASIKAAQAGADVHCGFCGTRNPAGAVTCSQCGADLKEGKARQSGQVMQAPAAQLKVIKCDNCGTENPSSNAVCSKCGSPLPKTVPAMAPQASVGAAAAKPAAPKKTNWLLIGGILGILALCCIGIVVLFAPSRAVEAKVVDVHWQTSVPLQEIRARDYSNEAGNPPSGAYDVSCHDESHEVCENKTVDKGNGYSEVIQECHDESQQYCSYTVDEWTTIQNYTLEGNDLNPVYDTPSISTDQRLGDQSEEFTVTFQSIDAQATYHPGTISEFQQFTIGSTWKLKMNALGGVVGVER